MKIWQRYLLKHITLTFVFLLFCLFALYTVVDLSIHGVRFLSVKHTSPAMIALYYLHNFTSLLDFFFPLTLMLSSLKVLLDLNAHREIVALQMAGLSSAKLLSPFFVFTFILVSTSYVNHEYFLPTAQEATATFRKNHSKKKHKQDKPHLFNALIQDKSEIIYQDVAQGKLFDLFWVKSNQEMWHIKYLEIDSKMGHFADHFQRNKQGVLEKIESFDTHFFPEMILDENINLQTFIPFENRPLSILWKQSFKNNAEKTSVLSHLHYKLASPLLSLVILLAIYPISMRYQRSQPAFLITAISLFLFIGFKTFLDGMLILSENQVIPSLLAIWGPILIVFLLTIKNIRGISKG
jgi:lipopolysaccharide export LptBFGC system permease protein LptF